MKLTGNTVFITGGGSGIGRGIAEALHNLGNKVIISGRRKNLLEEVTKANPGMRSLELDLENPSSIAFVSQTLIERYPDLNVVFNNAGIMEFDDAAAILDENLLTSTITTNLLGPIRMTSALIEHLKKQNEAAVLYTTSWLAFTPFALTAVYCATKAAMHSYALSQRYMLRGTSVRVIEIVPPWTQTDMLNSTKEPRAMPLQEFLNETMRLLGTDTDEVVVEGAKRVRNNAGPNEHPYVIEFNNWLSGV
ncbi:SDR family oxidoreductase [Terriglobus saanensis]|uniref:Short-chain dehydrogenase/reductase SDR n=1 Tax=Terriglobus saanensis (strain ATCC BAA-1853 / DSM 23119 / SP1PR4) TaxID=401053 RepID=E8UZM3_TERSS|nr:SDR family NAD(P)-dependent oxidoreductase [Terriglobus saanensis]ADV84366.1 short-chain dehydrogenase/reductase SDR [Terriglobus saanensis SP1PR4]